jgi:hypothetical protein
MHAIPPRPRAIVLIWLLLFSFGPLAHATTVIAPTFDELVNEAQTIVRARVLAVRSAWAESPQGRVIKTYVTVGVEKQLKGTAAAQLTLEFLGGELEGQGMRVSGMPQFAVGQIEILFISGNGTRFCPLVAMMHGRYRVRADPATGREYLTRNDGVPLTSEHDVQLPQAENPIERQLKPVSAALSPAVFEQRITNQLSRRAALP